MAYFISIFLNVTLALCVFACFQTFSLGFKLTHQPQERFVSKVFETSQAKLREGLTTPTLARRALDDSFEGIVNPVDVMRAGRNAAGQMLKRTISRMDSTIVQHDEMVEAIGLGFRERHAGPGTELLPSASLDQDQTPQVHGHEG